MQFTASIYVILVITTVVCNWSVAHVIPRHCTPCLNGYENECDDPPIEICIWGEIRDDCGRRVCGKGPGERCGGHLGMCGDGMVCTTSFLEANVARCHGCTVFGNLDCFPML